MSWICEICSSANEDFSRECFVCGQVRARESFIAGRRERREKTTNTVFRKVDRIASIVLKIVFFVALALCVGCLLFWAGKKIINGNIGEAWESLDAFWRNSSYNVMQLFSRINDFVGRYCGDAFGRLYENVSTVFAGVLPQIGFKFENYFESIIVPMYNKFLLIIANILSFVGIIVGRFRGA